MNHGIRNFHSPPKVEHRQEMSWNEEKLHVGPHNYYAWYAMVLNSIAWYFRVLFGIVWKNCMRDPITMRGPSLHEPFHPFTSYMPQHLQPISHLLHVSYILTATHISYRYHT